MPFDPYFSSTPPRRDKHIAALRSFDAMDYRDRNKILDSLYIKRRNGEKWTDEELAVIKHDAIHRAAYHSRIRQFQHDRLERQFASGAPTVVSRTFNTHKK